MSDDLTTAYLLGAEAMRSKLHEQADAIERLRERLAEADEANRRVSDENEQLRKDLKTAIMGDSAELQDVKRENEKLREAFKPFVDKYKWLFLDERSNPTFYADDGITLAQLWAARAAIRGSWDE